MVGPGEITRFRKTTERPVYKLSVELLKTYKAINELFYEQKRKKLSEASKPATNHGVDDDQGNYIVNVGEEIGGRYLVQEALGKGSFGVVVKALDQKRDECVAVKVIKNKAQFFQQAKVEMDILTKLNSQAGEEHNIVKLKKVFTWKDHLCLVFELLSFNLYDLLKYTKFNGISLNLVRKFAYQILKTLEFLSSPTIGIVHCDLKPENILLKNPKRSGIKVIDFGSSCYVTKKMFKYIQSRFYRSPEVILGLPYDCAIDMWSLGCVLVEMHTGQPIFDGKDEGEQLIKMACILGAQPQKMVEQSPKRRNFFQWDQKQKRWVLEPPKHDPAQYPRKSLEDILGMSIGGPGGRRKGQPGHAEADYFHFVDLMRQMFCYTPSARITPTAALQHPFLAPVLSELMGSPVGLTSPPSARVPPSPAYSTVQSSDLAGFGTARQAAENDVRIPLSTSYTASQCTASNMDLKWRSPPPPREAPDYSAKLAGQPRRISLPSAAQNATVYRSLPGVEPPDDGPPVPAPPTRTQSSGMLAQPALSNTLTRTRSVPHVASAAAAASASVTRKATGSPLQAPLEPCLTDTHSYARASDYQGVPFGSPTSPGAAFAHGPLRLRPKLPGGTAQPEQLCAMPSPQVSAPSSAVRTMQLLGSPTSRSTMYGESPNSGRYGPGTPVTPRTCGASELRQYTATGPLGSPLLAADGRKWLPSPMLADVTRKLLGSDSPCSGELTKMTQFGEARPSAATGLGSWKPPACADVSYGLVRTTVSHHHHHGGAEPMIRPVERELACDYI